MMSSRGERGLKSHPKIWYHYSNFRLWCHRFQWRHPPEKYFAPLSTPALYTVLVNSHFISTLLYPPFKDSFDLFVLVIYEYFLVSLRPSYFILRPFLEKECDRLLIKKWTIHYRGESSCLRTRLQGLKKQFYHRNEWLHGPVLVENWSIGQMKLLIGL